MKRQIRFREFDANQVIYKSPSVNYAKKSRNLNNNISYRIQTDSEGYIVSGREFDPSKKVCLIGDSLVESMFVKQSSRWNSYLEKLFLQNNYLFKCFNAGYSGATSLNIFNTLVNKVFNQEFDAILYFVSSNDYAAISYDSSYWNLTKSHSNLSLESYINEDRNYTKTNVFHFEALIKSIYLTATSFHKSLYFATYPNLSNERDMTIINRMLRDVCKNNNYPLFDMDKVFYDAEVSFESNFYDRRHLNNEGSVLFSTSLYDFFIREIPVSNDKITFHTKDMLHDIFVFNADCRLLMLQDVCSNEVCKKVSLNFVFDVDNSESNQNETLLVRLHFERLNSVKCINDIKYSDELGWYFYVSVPKGKTLENSHFFEVSFIGKISISIENRIESPKATINSISLETMYY